MRTFAAILSALLLSALGAVFAMPAMSNGGLLAGFEFFGLLLIGMLSVSAYALVAQTRARRSLGAWSAALFVGLVSPFIVLATPLAYCVAFQQNKSCM